MNEYILLLFTVILLARGYFFHLCGFLDSEKDSKVIFYPLSVKTTLAFTFLLLFFIFHLFVFFIFSFHNFFFQFVFIYSSVWVRRGEGGREMGGWKR